MTPDLSEEQFVLGEYLDISLEIAGVRLGVAPTLLLGSYLEDFRLNIFGLVKGTD